MAFSFGAWELAQALVKIVLYACMAASVGGLAVLWLLQRASQQAQPSQPAEASPRWLGFERRGVLRYVALAAGEGLLFAVLLFLLQVGAINQGGLIGMFDTTLAPVVAATPVGVGTAWRLAGFVLVVVAVLPLPRRLAGNEEALLPQWLWTAGGVALLCFASSIAAFGHVAPLSLPLRVAVALHVAAVLVWIGALRPLQRLSGVAPLLVLQPLLRAFGVVGWGLIGSLLLGGGAVLWQLLGPLGNLVSTAYGQTLLIKLMLVLCLLALAALNKFRLVPNLAENTRATLRISIGFELTLALLILSVTAVLTSLTGPPVGEAAY